MLSKPTSSFRHFWLRKPIKKIAFTCTTYKPNMHQCHVKINMVEGWCVGDEGLTSKDRVLQIAYYEEDTDRSSKTKTARKKQEDAFFFLDQRNILLLLKTPSSHHLHYLSLLLALTNPHTNLCICPWSSDWSSMCSLLFLKFYLLLTLSRVASKRSPRHRRRHSSRLSSSGKSQLSNRLLCHWPTPSFLCKDVPY